MRRIRARRDEIGKGEGGGGRRGEDEDARNRERMRTGNEGTWSKEPRSEVTKTNTATVFGSPGNPHQTINLRKKGGWRREGGRQREDEGGDRKRRKRMK